jgi:D-alanyl-D-alanine carboxypeptidase (penicillin-binding protein 5/6)
MRFLLKYLLVVVTVLWSLEMPAAFAQEASSLAPDELSGESAILIDATTGQVLFEKNPHVKLYPASITKIATGIYAIEKGNPDDIVTVSKKARYEEGTRVYLGEGEQVPLRKLEYGLLMHSGNDAATAIAEHLSQTTEQFAEELNAYLQEKVGVTETHFANAHGLHDPDHYTTASDMAKIAQYAMKNSEFREIVATNRLPWDGEEWKSELINHNKLLRDYEGATGIKNGFTDQAMHTLVGSAKRGDTELIAVTMKASASPQAYKDVTKMLDYGFANYETKQIASASEQIPGGSPADKRCRSGPHKRPSECPLCAAHCLVGVESVFG